MFIDSMQLMNSNLDKLAKNLSDKDLKNKYLIEELGSKNLFKQKGAYPYKYMDNFERFNEEKLPARKYFIALQKMEKLVMMVKYQSVT